MEIKKNSKSCQVVNKSLQRLHYGSMVTRLLVKLRCFPDLRVAIAFIYSFILEFRELIGTKIKITDSGMVYRIYSRILIYITLIILI